MNMKIKPHIIAISAALGFGCSFPANSSLNTELSNFYNSMSGAAAATPPAVYQGQSAYYATLGSLNARSPVRNYHLATLSWPSISAGCGGIDMYGGGFSFINKDEFVAMLKNIGSNAIGFAFQLALDVISPQISDELKGLMEKIEKIANMNINSCEAAQSLVGGTMKALDLQQGYCRAATRSGGTVSDGSAARQYCSNSADFSSFITGEKAKTDKSSKDMLKTFSGNVLWEGLKQRGLDPNDESQRSLMELVMSIVGTVVIPDEPVDDNGNPVEYAYSVGEIRFEDFVKPQGIDGEVTQVLKCVDPDECMQVVMVSVEHPDQLYTTISGLVDNIKNNIAGTGQEITNDELKLIGMTKLPIFALMQAAGDVGPDTLEVVADSVKTLAVSEAAYALIGGASSLALEALGATPNKSDVDPRITAFVERAKLIRQEAYETTLSERQKFGGIFEVMRQTNYWRTEAMNKFAPKLQQRMALARAFTIKR